MGGEEGGKQLPPAVSNDMTEDDEKQGRGLLFYPPCSLKEQRVEANHAHRNIEMTEDARSCDWLQPAKQPPHRIPEGTAGGCGGQLPPTVTSKMTEDG